MVELRVVRGALVLGALVAGCATAYSRGEEAFRAGRYQDAAREFEAARTPLTDSPRIRRLGLAQALRRIGD